MRYSLLEYAGHRLFVWLGAITILMASAMVIAVIRFRVYSRVFANTHEVLTAIVSLEASETEAEGAARAYFLTGDESFFQEFFDRRAAVMWNRDVLAKLVGTNSEERSGIMRLAAAVSKRVEHLSTVAALRQRRGPILGEHDAEDRTLAGDIAGQISAAKSRQMELLSIRRARRRQIELAVLTLCVGAALVCCILVVVGIRAMHDDLKLRDQSQNELQKSNAELERRVSERTAGIQLANDELQRSQRELSVLATALQRSNVDLESFAYAATHDLKEPLRTITLFAQLLQEQSSESISDDARGYLQTIIGSANRMDELIAGLLEYSQVSRDPLDTSEAADLNEVLAAVEQNLSAQLTESGAQLKHTHLPSLVGNRIQLIRLMQNLIENSIKHRSPERACRIEVEARREREFWAVSVRDNGLGFKPEYRDYIFGMFKRLDRARAGAGIGLATCKTIVERYGGKIWAEAEEGKGATFHFLWPVMEAPTVARLPSR